MSTSVRHDERPASTGLASRLGPRWPLVLLGALIVARLALAEWWLLVDERLVDTESGRHLQRAWDAYAALADGRVLAPFQSSTDYPPLLHLVGAAGAAVGGLDVESFIFAQDLVFVPALAIGCYGAGCVAYGRTAGLLAALFALGGPIALSVFHMFLIDTAEAAMVALSVWAILASNRFSRVGISALAGVAVGLGMLSKQNFPVFLVGLGLVVLLRGGWRNWRGLLAFLVVGALISASWYWSEVGRTLDLIRGSSGAAPATEVAAASSPSRWTTKNFGYYVWSTLNVSLLLPLALLTLTGTVASVVRWIRTRARDDHTPELVMGGLVAYLGMTWIFLKDPRYALPILPYMAVLGTGWLTYLRPRWRHAIAAAMCAVVALNVVGMLSRSGDSVSIALPGAPESALGERRATLYRQGGWVVGAPQKPGAVLETLRAAKAAGAAGVSMDVGATQPDFNIAGLDIFLRMTGLPLAYDAEDPRYLMLSNRRPAVQDPAPCAETDDGMGVYLSSGPVVGFEDRHFVCRPDGTVVLDR